MYIKKKDGFILVKIGNVQKPQILMNNPFLITKQQIELSTSSTKENTGNKLEFGLFILL